jgi:hypothetical protein
MPDRLPLHSYSTYTLPVGTVDCVQVSRRSSVRQLGGTATSSAGGTASNAFDGDTSTTCTQTSANGNISYDFGSGSTKTIALVGIRSNTTSTYALVLEGSSDGASYVNLATMASQSYTASTTYYFNVPVPTAYRYYRVRETAGATLDIQEIYLNDSIQDIQLSRLSNSEYFNMNNKTQTGTPSAFYVNRGLNCILSLWQTPDTSNDILVYQRIRQIQDITNGTQTLEVPYRFLEALTMGLSYRLSVKYAPDRAVLLKQAYDEAMQVAIDEDRERVTFSLVPDCSGYR